MEENKNDTLFIRILTPLSGTLHSAEYDYEPDEERIVEGYELVRYEKEIVNELKDMESTAGNELMQYFHDSDSIKEKVTSVTVSVRCQGDELFGCSDIKLKEPLKAKELDDLIEYITGQYSDGWGEVFEQRKIQVDCGNLYVHFWQPEDFKVRHVHTENISKQSQDSHRSDMTANRPKMQLLGHDGNIFAIMGTASRLLRANGQGKQVEEMINRVRGSGDYYKALGIISEYVETELSFTKPEQNKSKKNKREKGGEDR